jgi:hypothetical protein
MKTLFVQLFSLVGDDGAKNIEDIQEPLNKEWWETLTRFGPVPPQITGKYYF